MDLASLESLSTCGGVAELCDEAFMALHVGVRHSAWLHVPTVDVVVEKFSTDSLHEHQQAARMLMVDKRQEFLTDVTLPGSSASITFAEKARGRLQLQTPVE